MNDKMRAILSAELGRLSELYATRAAENPLVRLVLGADGLSQRQKDALSRSWGKDNFIARVLGRPR